MKAYYDAHHDDYMTPDSVHLSYVELSVPEVAAEVAVDEGGLKAYYESVKERFSEAEKRHARHILTKAEARLDTRYGSAMWGMSATSVMTHPRQHR